MIDFADIETGYEERYDFVAPARQPVTPYLLATVPRSGSTHLSHLLWATGCLGAPLEYLNFDATGPYGFAHDSPSAQNELWRSVVRRRTAPNGVFGVKCFPMQLEWLQQRNLPLLSDLFRTLFPPGSPRRVVWLGRRDRKAHQISFARAILSGVWRWEQERGGRPEPDFSEVALANAGRLIEKEERSWNAMFADMAIDPLRLWHEDVIAEPAAAVAAVARYLGVVVDPAARIAVPEIRKQSTAGAHAWAEALEGRGRGGNRAG